MQHFNQRHFGGGAQTGRQFIPVEHFADKKHKNKQYVNEILELKSQIEKLKSSPIEVIKEVIKEVPIEVIKEIITEVYVEREIPISLKTETSFNINILSEEQSTLTEEQDIVFAMMQLLEQS